VRPLLMGLLFTSAQRWPRAVGGCSGLLRPAATVARPATRPPTPGNRVGAWRLLETLAELRMPVACLANSAMLGHAPSLVRAYLAHAPGAELVGHGRTNSERQSELPEEAERRMIAECSAAASGFTGARPAGWLSPWIAESRVTPDLLAENGYSYSLNWRARWPGAPQLCRIRGGCL